MVDLIEAKIFNWRHSQAARQEFAKLSIAGSNPAVASTRGISSMDRASRYERDDGGSTPLCPSWIGHWFNGRTLGSDPKDGCSSQSCPAVMLV